VGIASSDAPPLGLAARAAQPVWMECSFKVRLARLLVEQFRDWKVDHDANLTLVTLTWHEPIFLIKQVL
jgi:hypothetical protein